MEKDGDLTNELIIFEQLSYLNTNQQTDQMKLLIYVFFLVFSYSLHAQTDQTQYKYFASITAGRNTHGSGDMRGISENISFGKYFRKKLAWCVGLGASLNDGFYGIYSIQANRKKLDHSYRYTAGAVQISGGMAYNFLRKKKNEAGVRLSGVLRYQSSSYFDQLLISHDPASNLPYPALYIFNSSPQRTFAVGFAPELFYNHSISKSLFLGLSAGFQADTNGDVLTNLSLSIGKRFK